MDPFLTGPVLIGVLILAGGVLFSRFIPRHREDVLPSWVGGILVALLIVPALVYASAKLLGTRVDPAALVVIAFALLSANYLRTRRARKK